MSHNCDTQYCVSQVRASHNCDKNCRCVSPPVRIPVGLSHICHGSPLRAFGSGTSVVLKPYPGGLRGFITVTANGKGESESRPIDRMAHSNRLCYSNLQQV